VLITIDYKIACIPFWRAVDAHNGGLKGLYTSAYPYDGRGFVGPKKKTIAGFSVFNPLCRFPSPLIRIRIRIHIKVMLIRNPEV
jgi:hypothetical protein